MSIILIGISRNFLCSGRSQSLYLFIRTVLKQSIVIIEAYPLYQLHTNFIKHLSVQVNCICRGIHLGGRSWYNIVIKFGIPVKLIRLVESF